MKHKKLIGVKLCILAAFIFSINIHLIGAEREFDFKINNISDLANKKKELEKKQKLEAKEKAKLEEKQKKEEEKRAKLESKEKAKLEEKHKKEEEKRAKLEAKEKTKLEENEKVKLEENQRKVEERTKLEVPQTREENIFSFEPKEKIEIKKKKEETLNFKEVKIIKKKEKKVKFPGLYIYKDAGYKENKYLPTGWMGDTGDLRMSSRCFVEPKSGVSCVKIGYSARQSQGNGWAGIYWQNPANNWGTEDKGFNLTGAKKLKFYIRGEKGGEIIDSFKVGGITGTYSDSADISFGPIILTKKWAKYEIDLKNYDLSHIIGGFCFVVTAESNPDSITFYLDEIVFE